MKRWKLGVATFSIVVIAAGAILRVDKLPIVMVGYRAKEICSCVFVQQFPKDVCESRALKGFPAIPVKYSGNSVTLELLWAKAIGKHTPGRGCLRTTMP